MEAQNFILCIHMMYDIVRKMTLSAQTDFVDELKSTMKEKFQLDFNYDLYYEDPDFDGQICSLVEIEEFPQKAVL